MSVDEMLAESQRLSRLLERVAELQAEKDRLDTEAKAVSKKLKDAEQMAVEELAASGLDGVRAAGKSWFVREFFSVSIPTENQQKVLEIARTECPEYIGVNTASLKSYLREQREKNGSVGDSLADGTPFAGLLTEFREMRLSRVSLG